MNSKEITAQLIEVENKKKELERALLKAIEDERVLQENSQIEATRHAILKLWDIFWSDEDNTEQINELNSINDLPRLNLWLEYDVASCLKKCKLQKLDEIKEICNGLKINIDKCIEDAKIRLDFANALRKVKDGTDLSHKLRWSFDSDDLIELMKLHKSNKFRKKIEDLLEDCNFHGECGLLSEKKYDEYIKYVTEEN